MQPRCKYRPCRGYVHGSSDIGMHYAKYGSVDAYRATTKAPHAQRACCTAFFGATTAASLLFVLTLLFVLRNFLGT